ncbi:MAG: DNA polymerase ligase N-terminal domain-containing protein [Patescibacteria group bacterium]|nr:DNA polymerase ligase N-terminal domain-containing protein [Patescibacteria group bacterium]
MSLEKYKEKRKFEKTSEPEGKGGKESKHRFVVQKHDASNLHYDFRLELTENVSSGDVVLKSWAVPKGVPEKKGIKRLAIETEDHPIDYLSFEGKIPKGEYGAGTVELWDGGKFELHNREKNLYDFKLKGEKLKGNYILVHPQSFKKTHWLIFRK